MSTLSPDLVEERIRTAVKDRIGETAMITRLRQQNGTIYLEVVAQIGLERTAKAVQQALDSIGSLLRSETLDVDVTISSPWRSRADHLLVGSGRVTIAPQPVQA